MLSFSFIILLTVPLPLWAWQLHHRVLNPSLPLPEPPFLNRASILSDAAGNLRLDSAPGLHAHFDSFVETTHVTDALYQLALDPHPGQSTSLWLTSSVKACHLVNAANEHIVLHVPHPGGTPFALDYFLDTAPSDGTCPPSKASGLNLALPHNVTITLSLPRQPPLPQLRVPPPLTATGDPIVRPPEKTFLQKYWLYIVIALGAFMIAPGPPEEGPRGS